MMDAYRKDIAALPDEVQWALVRADGYMDLRLPDRVAKELESVPSTYRTTAAWRHAALRLATAREDWPRAMQLAEGLQREYPDDFGPWIELAYAKRRGHGIPAARQILLSAWDRFPRVAVIPFNLACYACQQGDLDNARNLLSRAFALNEAYRAVAVEDEDLEPLWNELLD